MRKFNIIYVLAAAIALFLYGSYTNLKSTSDFFYGFAENKETDINYDEDVLVESIYVNTGQSVKKGDLLLTITNPTLAEKKDQLEIERQLLSETNQSKIKELRQRMQASTLEKQSELTKIDIQISEALSRIADIKKLYEGLVTIPDDFASEESTMKLEITNLQKRKVDIGSKYDLQIKNLQVEEQSLTAPGKLKAKILENEIATIGKKEQKMSITAPSDGIVGNVLCEKGEYVNGFRSFMNFYQSNPSEVKGYVHEQMILSVKVGDKFEVVSSLHPDHKVAGEVIGLGSRIVEIPERLRKMPDYKTYGREVIVKIPTGNMFLQKEKVMLKSSIEGKNNLLSKLLSLSWMVWNW